MSIADLFTRAAKLNRFPTELCQLPNDWNPAHCPARAGVEIKYDGIPSIWTNATGGRTREGVDFRATRHMDDTMRAIEAGLRGSWMMHGEYVRAEGFEAASRDFARGVGTGGIILFDAVPMAVYEGRAPSAPLWERRAQLRDVMTGLAGNNTAPGGKAVVGDGIKAVALIQQSIGHDPEGIELSAGVAWSHGLEGVVVKDLDSPYVCGRSNAWMRLKRKVTSDVRVLSVDLRPGTAILKAIVVDMAGKETRVGVGFTADQRARPGDFRPGVMVEVEHGDRPAGSSTRPLSFVRIRGDKA